MLDEKKDELVIELNKRYDDLSALIQSDKLSDAEKKPLLREQKAMNVVFIMMIENDFEKAADKLADAVKRLVECNKALAEDVKEVKQIKTDIDATVQKLAAFANIVEKVAAIV